MRKSWGNIRGRGRCIADAEGHGVRVRMKGRRGGRTDREKKRNGFAEDEEALCPSNHNLNESLKWNLPLWCKNPGVAVRNLSGFPYEYAKSLLNRQRRSFESSVVDERKGKWERANHNQSGRKKTFLTEWEGEWETDQVQGNHSGSSQPHDMKQKLRFSISPFVLKRNFCFMSTGGSEVPGWSPCTDMQ